MSRTRLLLGTALAGGLCMLAGQANAQALPVVSANGGATITTVTTNKTIMSNQL